MKNTNEITTYEEALEYIHGVSSSFCKPGLERIGELCERLGHPERGLKFIHVGGTNGKGSVSSMLDAILRGAGYSVGLYTSPYIVDFCERMRVDGISIPHDELIRLTNVVRPIAEGMQDKPTEFELITAIAFLYFKEASVDVVVLEVGLGGRLDSTNIIDSPLLSVITGIALDHTAILGDTVEKIAYEKAGIIKHGCPVLYGGEDDVAREVIQRIACERGSAYREVSHGSITDVKYDLSGTVFSYKDQHGLRLSLLGAYQPKNAATVLEAVALLRARGLDIDDLSVRSGLESTVWHARFEKVNEEPLVIFDGAHNPQGIDAAVLSIKNYFMGKMVYVLSGVLKDKDYVRIAKALATVAARVYTQTPDNPRALDAKEFAKVISEEGVEALAHESITDAVKHAFEDAKRDGVPLVCLGSLYTYADVVGAINEIK
ncbi:MAG: bifunctional folylpolyglutamate synthase/dihydrofolate synthase [Clostridia bacterium]|nr:bifunctional folylpolyglutamate synthase/dihydrofolate synthase [Clostridia bacterium]